MLQPAERISITNTAARSALCVRDYYFETRQSRIIVCAQCIHSNPEDSYANYIFISRHSVIIRLGIDPPFITCTLCHELLSCVRLLRVVPCLTCTAVAHGFLSTRTEVELRDLGISFTPIVVIIHLRRYLEFP